MDQAKKLKTLVEHLTDLLFRTWSAFLVARHIDSVIDNPYPIQNRYFFISAYASCVESSLLGFSKLMSDGKSEISITYLLNLCQQDLSAFPARLQTPISQAIQRHRQQLTELQPLIGHTKLWRDRSIAHIDRKYVNDPSTMAQMQPINMDAVIEGFTLLGDTINTYRKGLGLGAIRLEESEKEMAKDWNTLIGLIQQGEKEDQ